ncbi:MAG: anthranilate phosphoribosyltransferase [Candidatus Omnitrophota bacterium]
MILEATERLKEGKDLSSGQMHLAMEEIMTGAVSTDAVVSFLVELKKKGETVEELTAAVSVMRTHAVKISVDEDIVLDTCGTGGDKKGTFNVSTAVAFVACGAGITVAKHGNRSISSSSGSADVLEALGVNIAMEKEKITRCLKSIGIAFLFAPAMHPAMKYAMPARKQIGTRTIFNILGPLANPAHATHQLVGVYDRKLTEPLARTLSNLGARHALVVHGEDGLDEVTTTAPTFVSDVRGDSLKNYRICPEDFGLKRVELRELKGGTACDNAKILTGVLSGKAGPYRDIVLLNAACAIYAADKAPSIKEGFGLASISIDSGKALEKLALLKACSSKEGF